MSLTNTATRYGAVTKTFHWLTALLILTAIPLGWYANRLPLEPGETLALKAQLFSVHKTIGVAAFAVALLRILWALTQPRPAPMHPTRRAETWLAQSVHWALYAALVVVPLSGWVHHAATEGFAPILWPLGQTLPLVPKTAAVAATAASIHWVFTKVLIAALVLHIAGAVKHAVADRDATLARMLPGRTEAAGHGPSPGHAPAALAATLVYVAGIGTALALAEAEGDRVASVEPLAEAAGSWQVQEGTLGITVRQFGEDVEGRFAEWQADTEFSEEPVEGRHGEVEVTISVPSLTLGSVTEQAMGPKYFAAEEHPRAVFSADIVPAEPGYVAEGTVTLKGETAPVSLPFTMEIDGDTARMQGGTTLDRRSYDIGSGETNADNLGFGVEVSVDLTATRRGDRDG